MSDAFDDLERQLARAVRSAGRGTRRRLPRTAAFAAAAALVISGGALAATRLTGGKGAEDQGRAIVARALRESASNPACLPASASAPLLLSDSPPPKQITDALPDLAAAASAGEQRRALRLLIPALSQGRTVLRRTLRSFTLPDGLQLLVFVQLGGGINLRDPAACAKARREHAARLAKGRSAETLAAAQRRLAQLHDTAPGLQTLSVLAHIRGQASTGGTGLPVGPGQPLHPGLVLSAGAGKGRDLYVGIAGPHTTRLVATTRSTMRRVPSRVPVHHGFYALILPRGTGPVRLREITASGTTARVVQVR